MKRYHYITLLRILAMFSVIALHTILPPVTYYADVYTSLELKLSVLLLNIFRIYAVPIFFMISGALMLNPDKEITVEKCIKKAMRIIILLVVVGTIFALMEKVTVNHDFKIHYLFEAFFYMLADKSWAHLWYLYVLIGLYIITPCLRKIIENNGGGYLCIILVIFNFLIPFVNEFGKLFLSSYGWEGLAFNTPFVGSAITYFVLGWLFTTERIRFRNIHAISILCVLLLYEFFAVFVLHLFTDSTISFWDINTIPGVLFSVSVFSLFYNNFQNGTDSKFQIILSENSYGIYIFHAVFTNIFYQVIKLNPQKINIFIMWISVFSLTSILSFLLTYILRKIPIIKKFL